MTLHALHGAAQEQTVNEQIIGINAANGVSILIMGAVGLLILSVLRKLATGRTQIGNDPMANRIS